MAARLQSNLRIENVGMSNPPFTSLPYEQRWAELLTRVDLDSRASAFDRDPAKYFFEENLSVNAARQRLHKWHLRQELHPPRDLQQYHKPSLVASLFDVFQSILPDVLSIVLHPTHYGDPPAIIPDELLIHATLVSAVGYQHDLISVLSALDLINDESNKPDRFIRHYHARLHEYLAKRENFANERFSTAVRSYIRTSLLVDERVPDLPKFSELPFLALAPVLADLGYYAFALATVEDIATLELSILVAMDLGVASSALDISTNHEVPRRLQAPAGEDCASIRDATFGTSALPKFRFWIEQTLGPNAARWIWTLQKARARGYLKEPYNLGDDLIPEFHFDGDFRMQAKHISPDVRNCLDRLEKVLYREVGEARSLNLYSMIMEYPSSIPALEDLRLCLLQTNAHKKVAHTFKRALSTQLLHPGHTTSDIIHIYILTVRSLRYIDPTGVILSLVVSPIRAYLRSRPDTVSVIVTGLVDDDKSSYLRLELEAASQRRTLTGSDGNALARDAEEMDDIDEDDDEDLRLGSGASAWVPRPVSAGPNFAQTRTADIINMLITIFNDRIGFVGALEHSMAERLIKARKPAALTEVRTNEVLKRRFGDASFARCDIMIGDVMASKTTDTNVHALISSPVTVNSSPARKALPDLTIDGLPAPPPALRALHPIIVSRNFWPELEGADDGGSAGLFASTDTAITSPLQMKIGAAPDIGSGAGTNTLRMPGQLGDALELYGRFYTNVKDTRKLRWLTSVGRVKLCVEMRDKRTFEGEVTPIQAAVVELAGQSSNVEAAYPLLTAPEVAASLSVTEAAALSALYFWCAKGILHEVATTVGAFEVVEVLFGSGGEDIETISAGQGAATGSIGPVNVNISKQQIQDAITQALRTLGVANSNRLWTACRAHLGYHEPHGVFVSVLQTLRDEGLLKETERGAWTLL